MNFDKNESGMKFDKMTNTGYHFDIMCLRCVWILFLHAF